jgi:hypothetical protein
MTPPSKFPAVAAPALALALALVVPAAVQGAPPRAATAARASVLPFVEDDWERALHEARRLGIPIFIESWAPW